MQLTKLLPKLSGVRKGGNGYVARCPSHDDKHQSLSLSESDGRILINCFAGCTAKEIANKLGLSFSDLFDKRITKPGFYTLGHSENRINNVKHPSWFVTAPGKRIQTVYQYRDADGTLLYENVRFFPKDFRQRQFDAKGKAVWSLEGVKRVPYRLTQLIECGLSQVFLCEGEKDADALRDLGFTSSSFKSWREEFNHYILGKDVIIVSDHDLPGQKQAEEAARIAVKAAKTVKMLDLFAERELPEKNGPDVSDYIKMCVSDEGLNDREIAERIGREVKKAPVWKDIAEPESSNLFVVKSGNEWLSVAKEKPVPKMLLGEFWFEGEICILFADTNVGKSILAVQAADAISRGVSLGEATRSTPLVLSVEAPAQKVVYFDFELTSKQFESRFSERVEGEESYTNHYQFHPNFYRAEINPETSELQGFDKFEDYLNHSLDSTIISSGAKVLIIDNLTYLRDETENARNALPLMKYLKELKSRHGLSILTLAHTPKRDSSKPLGRNDLQGSKMLINFCDSSFAIGESHKEIGIRYIKQIKARNTEIIYHGENVLLAKIRKDSSFLHFDFIGTGSEREHLKPPFDGDKPTLIAQVKKAKESGKSIRQLSEEFGIPKSTVGRYIAT
jgi:transposase